MESRLYFDREVVCPFEDLTKDIFLGWYPGQLEKWEVFQKLRHDWISKYGSLKEIAIVNGKKVSFLSKVIWSFQFMDQSETIKV